MYQCVIFDLDGTLLNTLEDLAAAGNYALSRLGHPLHDPDQYRQFVGNGIPKLIEWMLPPGSGDRDAAHRLFSDYYADHKADCTRPYDGIPALLERLRNKGVKTAVVTNKEHDFAEALIRGWFRDTVDVIYGSRPGVARKPDPVLVHAAMQELGVEPEHTLYVGDSSVDIQTARNAGVESCGVLWGFRSEQELKEAGAGRLARTAEELYKIIVSSV